MLHESGIHYDAVVMLGFGGPQRPEEIRPFLDRVLSGRPIPKARYDAVITHYMQIGGRSPYHDLTQHQANGLARALAHVGINVPVEVAYRYAEPFVESVMARLAESNAKNVLGIVLAPHGGSVGSEKYVVGMENACQNIGPTAPRVDYVESYFDHPLFVRAHAERLKAAVARLGRVGFDGVEVIFTAHSIPQSAAGADIYIEQFLRSAKLIAQAVEADRWSVGYQSRSGSPSELWLEPDVRDVLRQLPSRGVREAVVAPIGFLCDHVEVLYDLDVDAKNIAQSAGVRFERAEALNDHPDFVQMLAELTVAGMRGRRAAEI